MSGLPTVAWIVEGGRIYRAGAVTREAVADRDISLRADGSVKAALVRLSDAQQRIEELEREIARLKIRGEAYENAYRIAYQATFQSHTGHWDAKGTHGANCPECIRAREARENCDAALREGLEKLAERAARGIVSPEGIETGTGSTAQPPEPGPAGARPSKGFLKGESPQATWPFAQDDKGTE